MMWCSLGETSGGAALQAACRTKPRRKPNGTIGEQKQFSIAVLSVTGIWSTGLRPFLCCAELPIPGILPNEVVPSGAIQDDRHVLGLSLIEHVQSLPQQG